MPPWPRTRSSPAAPVIAPNENLVAEGIPPIPAALAEEVRRYTEGRSARFLDWHPTRREMLVSTRFADTPQVHLVKAPMGARTQLTFFPERVGDALWQPTQGDSSSSARTSAAASGSSTTATTWTPAP